MNFSSEVDEIVCDIGTTVEHLAGIWLMLNNVEGLGYGRSAIPDWLTIQICDL
jgi:hypothetical protein